ncbi:unnamed protein product [Clonostachys solani]|uniref:Uncharacterized protein n=1 Tax=Clonostachys solani TaxID=160281 RepID=A0A9P0EG69_9HYPO|nr:unnamed protein product [Clonostachys solani]
MVTQDDFPTASAVDEIVSLTRVASVEAAADALYAHADLVSAILVALAKRIPHDQQSKLVDFTVRLGNTTVPDPTGEGVLFLRDGVDMIPFWSGMPRFSINLAEEWLKGPGIDPEETLKNLDWGNLVAFYAQLSEAKFWRLFEQTGWNHGHLTQLFEEDVIRQDVVVACMWLIHAPKKIWTDIQRRRKHLKEIFELDLWSRWKKYLQDYQQKLVDDGSDEELQSLISGSLDSMNTTEAELGK